MLEAAEDSELLRGLSLEAAEDAEELGVADVVVVVNL